MSDEEPGKTTREPEDEVRARMRAFDLLATPFGDEPLFEFYERIGADPALEAELAFMLDVENFQGYVFLGFREGAPTFTYEGNDALDEKARIKFAPMDAETGEADASATVICQGARDATRKLMVQVSPPPKPGLRLVRGGKEQAG